MSKQWSALKRRLVRPVGSIGIDFLDGRVCAIQLERSGSSLVLREARSVILEGSPEALLASRSDLRRTLADLFRHSRFKGRNVVTRVLSDDLRLMVLSYKVEAARSESEQILGLTRERMRDDLDGHVVDFLPIRTSGDQQGERSALVAIAPEEPVIEQLERLRKAGLSVEALEIAPVAIWRVFSTLVNRPSTDVSLILQLGSESTQLTLISGRRFLLYREVEFGIETMLAAVGKELDCDAESARELLSSYGVGGSPDVDREVVELDGAPPGSDRDGDIVATLRETVRPALRGIVEQAHKAISYAAFQTRGTSLDTVYLMAEASVCPGLAALLAEMLQARVQSFEPLASVAGSRRGRTVGTEQTYSIALGMALRGMVDA